MVTMVTMVASMVVHGRFFVWSFIVVHGRFFVHGHRGHHGRLWSSMVIHGCSTVVSLSIVVQWSFHRHYSWISMVTTMVVYGRSWSFLCSSLFIVVLGRPWLLWTQWSFMVVSFVHGCFFVHI